jgi:hypothetical protein
MAQAAGTRIQLCGRHVVRLDGRRVDEELAGTKGQLLFAYLVLNRFRRLDRGELMAAVYGEDAPPDHQPRFSVLLSKLRRVVGPGLVTGRSEIELVLSPDAFVDVEAALDGLHRAPPALPTTSPAGLCSRATIARGWTNGGDASTTSGCEGSNASQPPGSALAGRRSHRPRIAPAN